MTREHGLNLIELIIAIVIISIACTGVLLVYAQAVQYSADPMIQTQALAIAEATLDEVLARPIADPPDGTTEIGGSEEGNPSLAANRPLLDDVQDYHGMSNSPPLNQNGIAEDLDGNGQADLAGYTVSVAVFPNETVSGLTMARIDVTVQYPPVVNFVLTGYRAAD